MDQELIETGKKLFLANCASCHGKNAEGAQSGPSLIGVGSASVDFQVATGRMPGQASGPQMEVKPVQFKQEDIDALAAYVASLAPGPESPTDEYLAIKGDAAKGGELFRINCAMCHNAVGAGGALTEGKYAPPLKDTEARHVYQAMVTGPQNMPTYRLKLKPTSSPTCSTFKKTLQLEEKNLQTSDRLLKVSSSGLVCSV